MQTGDDLSQHDGCRLHDSWFRHASVCCANLSIFAVICLHILLPTSPAFWNMAGVSATSITFTPPAAALWHCCSCMPARAECTATRELLQAVSTARAGPCSPKV
jgi:hypothetical protein